MKICRAQAAARGGPGEHGHQLGLVAVLAHQHRGQLFADLHQVAQVGDAVLGDQMFHQADALQPRAGTQGFAHVGSVHARQVGNGSIGLWGVVHLELDQQGTQVTLVARQRAIQQQRTLGLVQLQQAGESVDVFLHQRGLLFQGIGQPRARGAEQCQQILGRVLGVFVEVVEKRALFIGAAPHAVALQEFGVGQRLVATPEIVGHATPRQKCAYPPQHRRRPGQMAPGERKQAAQVAPYIKFAALPGGQGQHQVGTHQVQHGCIGQTG